MAKKFQPKINPYNSIRLDEVPSTILAVSNFWSLSELEKVLSEDPGLEPCYILTADSSKDKLKPYRDKTTRKFLLLLIRRE